MAPASATLPFAEEFVVATASCTAAAAATAATAAVVATAAESASVAAMVFYVVGSPLECRPSLEGVCACL